MKLDVNALRCLTNYEFRVLTAVEMGMKNVSIVRNLDARRELWGLLEFLIAWLCFGSTRLCQLSSWIASLASSMGSLREHKDSSATQAITDAEIVDGDEEEKEEEEDDNGRPDFETVAGEEESLDKVPESSGFTCKYQEAFDQGCILECKYLATPSNFFRNFFNLVDGDKSLLSVEVHHVRAGYKSSKKKLIL